MSVIVSYGHTRRSVRVLTCLASPSSPREVHELAAVDVTVDGGGARFNGLRYKVFALAGQASSSWDVGWDSRHVAACVWGGRSPDLLVSHDAVTASMVFTPDLTGGVPWVSTHKIARRVWPGQHCFALESLARWRAWPGPREPFSSVLPSGAARDAELTARLFLELLDDPGLINVAETAFLDGIERGGSGVHPSLGGWNALDAVVAISSLPSRPLRDPIFPFEDPAEWAGLGIEDLHYFARFSDDRSVAEAARAALKSREGSGGRHPLTESHQ